ncbi:MAG TPA: hypothetical protein VFZ68_06880, partial [Acidimicrobiales bacterium]
EADLDGLNVVSIVPPRSPRAEPERIELRTARAEGPLVTAAVSRKSRSDRDGRRRGERGDRRERGPRGDRADAGREDRQRRDRRERRERPGSRPARQLESKPKPKRLRPGKVHRSALLEALPAEQRPIAEQLLAGGIPSVRQAIDKQNQELRAEGKPEVKRDALLKVAEDLRPRVLASLWRDRAEAAVASADEIDLRDLRSVVNAASDAARDEESRALAAQLREALSNRVEKEHATWLAEMADSLRDGRVVRALRLSSRPPKAGAPIPGDLSNQLVEATAAALTEETSHERWATVLDALAYSPVRRRVVPQSLPTSLSPELRANIARLGNRLPEIAHIFAIEPDPTAGRTERRSERKGRTSDERTGGRRTRGSRRGRGAGRRGTPSATADSAAKEKATQPVPTEPAAKDETTEPVPTEPAAKDETTEPAPGEPTPAEAATGDEAVEPAPTQEASDDRGSEPVATATAATAPSPAQGEAEGQLTEPADTPTTAGAPPASAELAPEERATAPPDTLAGDGAASGDEAVTDGNEAQRAEHAAAPEG